MIAVFSLALVTIFICIHLSNSLILDPLFGVYRLGDLLDAYNVWNFSRLKEML